MEGKDPKEDPKEAELGEVLKVVSPSFINRKIPNKQEGGACGETTVDGKKREKRLKGG